VLSLHTSQEDFASLACVLTNAAIDAFFCITAIADEYTTMRVLVVHLEVMAGDCIAASIDSICQTLALPIGSSTVAANEPVVAIVSVMIRWSSKCVHTNCLTY
jgi:hypothetical protein